MLNWLFDRLIDGWMDWFIDLLMDWLIYWLIAWWIACLVVCLFDWLILPLSLECFTIDFLCISSVFLLFWLVLSLSWVFAVLVVWWCGLEELWLCLLSIDRRSLALSLCSMVWCSLSVFLECVGFDLLCLFLSVSRLISLVFYLYSYVVIDLVSLGSLLCLVCDGVRAKEVLLCLFSIDRRSLALFHDWFLSYFICILTFWLFACLFDWLFVCWVDYLIDCVFDWLFGWLIVCLLV